MPQKFRIAFVILIFFIILKCFARNTQESTPQEDNYAIDEEILYKFHRYENQLKWMWSQKSFCRVVCPRGMGVVQIEEMFIYILVKEVLLEGPGCVKFEAEMLVCSCDSRRPGRLVLYAFRTDPYLNGPNGEIYRLKKVNAGICSDRKTLAIYDRVVSVEGVVNTLQQQIQKLRGVSRIFKTQNDVRAEWRQWNVDRVSGGLSDNDDGHGERRRLRLDDFESIRSRNSRIFETSDETDDDEDDDEDYSENYSYRVLLRPGEGISEGDDK